MQNNASVRIGMLTPSSNTVVEPVVAAMLTGVPEVTAHASRLRVTEISLEDDSQHQFDLHPMLVAAELLADARVTVMGWNGTSASWLGFNLDRRLCETMTGRFGVPSTSAVLAINDLIEELAARRIAFVTPYVDTVQARIIAQYRETGYDCIAERHTGEHVNYAFAEIADDVIMRLIREVAAEGPDAIIVMCTNMHAAHLVDALEQELNVTVIDSLAAYVWKSLRLGDVDTRRITGWGRIFQCKGVGSW
jgi:maleate isomerase